MSDTAHEAKLLSGERRAVLRTLLNHTVGFELTREIEGHIAALEVEQRIERAQYARLEGQAEIAVRALESGGQRIRELEAQQRSLEAKINTPELRDFASGVVLEAAHQRERWASDHDAGKTAADWFWLIGYLAQKCMYSHIAEDNDKALHHAVTTAAAMANWHAAILGQTNMRPGIDPAEKGIPE